MSVRRGWMVGVGGGGGQSAQVSFMTVCDRVRVCMWLPGGQRKGTGTVSLFGRVPAYQGRASCQALPGAWEGVGGWALVGVGGDAWKTPGSRGGWRTTAGRVGEAKAQPSTMILAFFLLVAPFLPTHPSSLPHRHIKDLLCVGFCQAGLGGPLFLLPRLPSNRSPPIP